MQDRRCSTEYTKPRIACWQRRVRRPGCETSHIGLMDVTPNPVPRLVSLHDGMSSFVEVFGGVASGRGVAAGDIAADQTNAQFNRPLTERLALLAFLATGLDLQVGLAQVF